MKYARFTGTVVFQLLAVFAIVTLLSVLAPTAAPRVGEAAAATGYYNRSVTWWFDDSTDDGPGGNVYRVKVSLSWQTMDPHQVCHTTLPAAPDGTHQGAFTNIPVCPAYYLNGLVPIKANHFYPSQNFEIACWVSNSFLISTTIDYCGKFPGDPQSSPPYYLVYGDTFHICVGVQGTPFNVCDYMKSKGTILGSSVSIWNSGA